MDYVLTFKCPECDKKYEHWCDMLTNRYEDLVGGYETDKDGYLLSHCFDCACRVFHGMEPGEYIEKKLKQICFGCGGCFPALEESCPSCEGEKGQAKDCDR